MGYTTEFSGVFKLDRPLDEETKSFLLKFSKTRRMGRNVDPKYGIEGEFYVDGSGDYGQEHDDNIIDYNVPPKTQPSLWCDWVPSDNGTAIKWNGGEKFYCYIEWLRYIIKNFLQPKGYLLNGTVLYRGEDITDQGKIVCKDNVLTKRPTLKLASLEE